MSAGVGGAIVCGLGASAGGLEALSDFLDGLDGLADEAAGLGVVFVVVQHLHPDHPTRLPELLERHTPLPVELAEDEVRVVPGRVYVIPPRAMLHIKDGVVDDEGKPVFRLVVTPMDRAERPRGPAVTIDRFFESIADEMAERAIGVVLSGMGSDGTLGLRAIKERGGLALGQEGATAKFSSMPDAAAADATLLDDILPAKELGPRVLDYARRLGELRLVSGGDEAIPVKSLPVRDHNDATLDSTADAVAAEDGDEAASASVSEADEVLSTVSQTLGQVVGYDFGGYKPGTILRRVERRMHVLKLNDPRRYIELLQSKDGDGAAEARLLFADLLIGVTQFFRDAEAFEALEREVMPGLFNGRERSEPVRIWSAGCSTGEEAYSLAMLAVEAREKLSGRPRPAIQIFASDLDARALSVARHGRYPKGIDQHLRPDRLDRFFRRDGDEYVVSQELRDMVLFSRHSLIADPPFGRIDLLACRNLLIYLQSGVQKKLMPLLHYALRPGGTLFLGGSETLGGERSSGSRLFEPISVGNRIYRRRDDVDRPPVTLPQGARVFGERSAYDAPPTTKTTSQGLPDPQRVPPSLARRLRDQRVDKALLDRFAPPAAAVDASGELIYTVGRTDQFLSLPEGRVDGALTTLVSSWLRADVTALVQMVKGTRSEQERAVRGMEGHPTLRLVGLPLADDLTLIIFDTQTSPDRPEELPPAVEAKLVDDTGLRRELVEAREDLADTIDQLEVSNEQLKSGNEELLSLNEELQSANEELQTSKEEYQSTNEELETVNSEMRQKVEELNEANADLQNLFASTLVPTVFLDRGLRIKRFTPSAREVFRLRDEDIDRHIGDVKTRFIDGDLDDICRGVLDSLDRYVGEVRRPAARDGDERVFTMRITPYRTLDDLIEGVVLTFADVSDLKRALSEREQSERSLRLSLRASRLGMWSLDVESKRMQYDERSREIWSLPAETSFEEAVSRVPDPTERESIRAGIEAALNPSGDGRYENEHRWLMKDGTVRWMGVLAITTFIDDETPDGARRPHQMYGVATDITDRHESQRRLADSGRRLRRALVELESIYDNAEVGLAVLDRNYRHRRINKRLAEINGVSVEKTLGKTAWEILPSMTEKLKPLYDRVFDGESILNIEIEGETPAEPGVKRAFLASYLPLRVADQFNMEEGAEVEKVSDLIGMGSDDDAEVTGINVVVHEITTRKKIESQVEAARAEAESALAEAQEARDDARAAGSAKDRFLAALSHELRTPLTPVLAAASHAVKNGGDVHELAELVRRNVDLEVRLIDDLLDMTRIDRGKLHLERVPCDVADVIKRAIGICQPIADDKKVTISFDPPEGLPAAYADPTRLTQIAWNLINNAVKFTDAGGRVSIAISAVTPPGNDRPLLSVAVSDNGQGISPDMLTKVFEAFEQGGTNNRHGLGLGLAISRSLVELHGGSITTQSEGAGRGATFTFTLPTTDDKPGREAAAPVANPAAAINLLLVEDHGDTGRVLTRLLRSYNINVRLARSVAEGDQLFDPEIDEILLSDVGLPDGDGNEMLRRLRKRAPNLPAVALSGYGSEADLSATSDAGFAEHVVKPVDIDYLVTVIHRVIAEHRSETSP